MIRMLLAVVGGGAAFSPPLRPPNGADWTRVGTVLSPGVAWEQTSIQEPDVYHNGSEFVMFAKGGWASTALGRYTSADGETWTPYAGNPVLGGGGSGFAPELSQPTIFDDAGTLYCYFNSGGDSDPNTPRYATSADGIAWTVGGSGSFITNPGAITQWGNHYVWKEGPSTWYMLLDARSGGLWQVFLATSSDGLSWTITNGPLTSLQPDPSHIYGGLSMFRIQKLAGTYHAWFHAGAGLLSDIYHATSTDLINWTISPGTPILTHTGSGDEAEQIADPSIVVVGSTAYMFYAGVDNTGETGVVRLATAPAG